MLTEDDIYSIRVIISELKEEFEEKYEKKDPDFYKGAKEFAKKLKERLSEINGQDAFIKKLKSQSSDAEKSEPEEKKSKKFTFTDDDHEVKKFINDTTKGFKDTFRKGKI